MARSIVGKCAILLFLLLLEFVCYYRVNGLIPKACKANITSTASVCCPTPKGFAYPCGYPTLGKCEALQIHRQILRAEYLYNELGDIRMFWPERLYSHVCKCRGRRWGPDCTECIFGYTGKNCDQRYVRIRRNIDSYSKDEKQQLVSILLKSRHVKSQYVVPYIYPETPRWSGEVNETDVYTFIDFLHWLGAMPAFTTDRAKCIRHEDTHFDNGHLDAGFLNYHRYILLLLERLLADVAKKYFGINDFTLPYWDWTNRRECTLCTDDLFGTETNEWNDRLNCNMVSRKSPFGSIKEWPVFCQRKKITSSDCAPCHVASKNVQRLCRHMKNTKFPTAEEIIESLEMTRLVNHAELCNGFEAYLEGGRNYIYPWKPGGTILHGRIHELTAGTLKPSSSSIFDPLFVFHHTQTDRLWERWSRALTPSIKEFPNINVNEPMCRQCYISPFFPLVTYRELSVDSRSLGYTYENFNFGPLSEKVKIAKWDHHYHVECILPPDIGKKR